MKASPTLDPTVSASVSASAGTGKTWLLTARIARLLLAGARPGGILALTFTRKAAAEMRNRVNARLRALSTADRAECDRQLTEIGLTPTDALRERAQRLYREHLFQPYPLRATTLHAFCQELVSRFAFEAGVTPGFRLIEQEAPFYDRAWRQVQQQILRQPQSPAAQAFTELIELGCGEFKLRALVMGFLQRRSDWRALGPQADTGLLAELSKTLNIRDGEDPYAAIQAPAFRFHLKELWGLLQQGGAVGSITPERLGAAVEADAADVFEALCRALLRSDGEFYTFKPAKKNYSDAQRETLMENYLPVQQALAQALARKRALDSLRRNRAALQLGMATLAAFDRLLARDNALGFAEIEGHALQLLQHEGGAEWVRYKLDPRMDHLLLDEFQDTNPTQWRLLLPLLQEMAAGDEGRARSAFIVGDTKQSIYGFRRAQPELFGVAADWLDAHLNGVRESQTRTWRSAPAVVDFVNALFSGELAREIGFEPHSTAREQDWGRVEVAALVGRDAEPESEPDLRDPLTHPRLSREETRAQREAALVAERIARLVESGVAVRGDGGPHRLGYGDVLILARQHQHLIHIERALSSRGIPYVGAARGTLLNTAEARDLTALLRFLDAPHRNLELAQVLRSPLFSLEHEPLIRLARSEDSDWFASLVTHAKTDAVLQRPAELLSRWQRLSAQLPVHDLLDRIVTEADAAHRYEQALPPAAAARVRANLGAFLQLALSADSGRFPSLSSFLTFLDEQKAANKDAPDEAPPTTHTGQVRILTIHAAKGLEAPAVFVVNAGSQSDRARPTPWLVDWPADADRPQAFLTPGNKQERDDYSAALLERQKERDARENLNLLYVAVTRARQFLHLSGFVSGNSKKEPTGTWHAWALQAMSALGDRAENDARVHTNGTPSVLEPEPVTAALGVDPRLSKPLPALNRVRPPSGDSTPAFNPDAALRGDAIHFLLQRLATDRAEGPALPAALAQTLGRTVSDADYRAWLEEAQTVLKAKTLARFFDPALPSWNEVPLLDPEGVGGIADRVVDDGQTIWILDYKTTPSPDPAALLERYRPQLTDYINAARTVWPQRRVRGGLILTATAEWLEIAA